MYTEQERNIITLACIEELNYNARRVLLSDCENGTPDFVKNESALIKTLSRGVYNKVKAQFSDSRYRERLFSALAKRGVKCVTCISADYPPLLKEIPQPPHVLFCKGDVSLLRTRCFSVVGSRRTLTKQLEDCRRFAGAIAARFTVVSGIAEGADAAALEGAMQKGRVISALAYGFDYAYPAMNAQLIKRIAAEGLLISEYPPETQPKSYYFPVRNRIIAGLSEGTLVVSAAKKSGALITADIAAESGRDVFAFPYSVGVASGEGCNLLIKKGAYLADNILDIFGVYGLDLNTPQQKPMTDGERAVYEAILASDEAFIPEIAEKLGKQPWQLIPLVSALELKNLVVRLGGNRYSAVR